MSFRSVSLALVLLPLSATQALAQPGPHRGWGGADWWAPETERAPSGLAARTRDSREGKVDAETFAARETLAQLGHGPIGLVAHGTNWPEAGGGNRVDDPRAFEAAVIDRLVQAGYDTATPDPDGGQIAEFRVLRVTLATAQPKAKPVSGELDVGVSNRGSMVGVGISVDLRKPLSALVSTRLEARVRDRATGKTLWEGHADIATYDGDGKWSDEAIAARLASALFEDFPRARRNLLVSN